MKNNGVSFMMTLFELLQMTIYQIFLLPVTEK